MSVRPRRLPERPSLEQLRKQAKEHLDTLRAADPSVNLAAAQHALARDGVHAIVLTDRSQIETVLEYVTRGNTAQIGDRAFERALTSWIRCNETDAKRFALPATALGIRNAFLNQPVEVAPLRSQFAAWLKIGDRRPDLVLRFGRGPEMPRSRRRPIEDVLV